MSNKYEVGYRKPPKAYQFQKGKSGNLEGRRGSPAPTWAKVIEEAWMAPITVTTETGSRKSTGFELIVLQLMARIAKGIRKAHKVLLKYEAYAKTKPRLKKIGPARIKKYSEIFAEWDDGDSPGKASLPTVLPKETPAERKKRTLAGRIERMKAGLEPIKITSDMSAQDASDLWYILKDQPWQPKRRKRRDRRGNLVASEIFDRAINAHVTLNDGGTVFTGPRMMAVIKRLLANAVRGDVRSADMLVVMHEQSLKHGDYFPETKVALR